MNQEGSRLQQVDYRDVQLVDPELVDPELVDPEDVYESVAYLDGEVIHGEDVIYEDMDYACDAYGCDSYGCDSMSSGSLFNSSLSFCRDQWFGSLELLTMHRSGDRLPTLVTTGPDDANADAQVLFGGERLLKDGTVGGRVTIGTWIDASQCRSLVLRGWIAGEDDFSFSRNQDQSSIIGRPFRNVSDGVTPFDDVRIIASPGRASGSIQVDGSSNVFGGDLSVRQYWYGNHGGTIDLLYGYQYMRLNEDLRLSSSSVSLDDDFAPVGSILGITDSFDTLNEFHGGQLGISGRYREACWSFEGLAKVGFGSLRRSAKLRGETFTSIDGNNATDPQGLLVRNTNGGTTTDHTFGWVPELDFSIGYHKYPNYELTMGYHIIAMTDALQVSGAIDPNLASNLSDPPTGSQRPAASLRYDTFYVQGIHFGIQYVH